MRDMERKRAYDRERGKRRRVHGTKTYDPEKSRAWREAHPDYQREWRKARPNYRRDWQAAHPNYRPPSVVNPSAEAKAKKRARATLYEARQRGAIRVLDCEVCGVAKVHGHHAFGYDESVALAVWWLCPTHHAEMHAMIRRA